MLHRLAVKRTGRAVQSLCGDPSAQGRLVACKRLEAEDSGRAGRGTEGAGKSPKDGVEEQKTY